MKPCSRSPWAAWFRFMKSMSISSLGISLLYWVAKWHQGLFRSRRPSIHILEGEKVWHQVTMPAHSSRKLASFTTSVISLLVLAVTL